MKQVQLKKLATNAPLAWTRQVKSSLAMDFILLFAALFVATSLDSLIKNQLHWVYLLLDSVKVAIPLATAFFLVWRRLTWLEKRIADPIGTDFFHEQAAKNAAVAQKADDENETKGEDDARNKEKTTTNK